MMGALFPRYYALQIVAGLVALHRVGGALARRAQRAFVAGGDGAVAFMLAAALYAGVVVEPRAQALRVALHASPPTADTQEAFDRVHRDAVRLNGAVLLLGIASIAVAATTVRRS